MSAIRPDSPEQPKYAGSIKGPTSKTTGQAKTKSAAQPVLEKVQLSSSPYAIENFTFKPDDSIGQFNDFAKQWNNADQFTRWCIKCGVDSNKFVIPEKKKEMSDAQYEKLSTAVMYCQSLYNGLNTSEQNRLKNQLNGIETIETIKVTYIPSGSQLQTSLPVLTPTNKLDATTFKTITSRFNNFIINVIEFATRNPTEFNEIKESHTKPSGFFFASKGNKTFYKATQLKRQCRNTSGDALEKYNFLKKAVGKIGKDPADRKEQLRTMLDLELIHLSTLQYGKKPNEKAEEIPQEDLLLIYVLTEELDPLEKNAPRTNELFNEAYEIQEIKDAAYKEFKAKKNNQKSPSSISQ